MSIITIVCLRAQHSLATRSSLVNVPDFTMRKKQKPALQQKSQPFFESCGKKERNCRLEILLHFRLLITRNPFQHFNGRGGVIPCGFTEFQDSMNSSTLPR